jgi:hypothetical protein
LGDSNSVGGDLFALVDNMNNALPIGYLEVQRGWVAEPSDGPEVLGVVEKALSELDAEMAVSNPLHVRYGARVEHVADGAGVQHVTLYVGYAPKETTTEPLNPHNLNDAQNESIGDPARDNSIGMKEQKF